MGDSRHRESSVQRRPRLGALQGLFPALFPGNPGQDGVVVGRAVRWLPTGHLLAGLVVCVCLQRMC